MKKIYVFGAIAFLLSIIIFSGDTFSAQTGSPYTAKVVSTDGYVDVKYAGTEKFVTLPPGKTVGIGDVIETDNEGKVELKLPDGSKLVIGENSRIVIKELGVVEVTKVSKSAFELVKGKIRAIVNPFISKDSEFNIETNNATVGVRGTDFGETYDPDVDTTYVLGMTGTLSLFLKHFSGMPPVIIEKGHEVSISGSNKPAAPSEINKETIEQFLKGMEVTGTGGAGVVNPPYITGIFINRTTNLEDLEGTLTVTKDDLNMDGKIQVNGGAVDEAYKIKSVEVSLDRGTTWNPAEGTTSWTYAFIPQNKMEYELMVRATNEKEAVSDSNELGVFEIVYDDTSAESIARSVVDKLFSYMRTADYSVFDLISENYDGEINGAYSKAEAIDGITDSFQQNPNQNITYTIDQINVSGDKMIVTTRWASMSGSNLKQGTTKFWVSKSDGFRFVHTQGDPLFGGGEAKLLLENIIGIESPPCDTEVRVMLYAPNIPASVTTVTAYSSTYCETNHFMILTRTYYEDLTGKTGGFGGNFILEKSISACYASYCSTFIPFLYSPSLDPSKKMTVTFNGYGYNLSQVITLP